MSLIICVYVEEGIVLASDSRSTYNVQENEIQYMCVHHTDTTNKTFLCPNNIGIATCGDASIDNKPIAGFIEAFIREKIDKNTDIDEIPELIKNHFQEISPQLDSTFIIAGYKNENGKLIKKIYRLNTKLESIEKIDTTIQGATWSGEAQTLIKLLNITYIKNQKGEFEQLQEPRYIFGYYTLQDAIDFAKYGIKTTIDAMKFQAVPETVGGPIDILVIKPEETQWLSKKELKG